MKWYHWIFGSLVPLPMMMLVVIGSELGPWVFFGCIVVSGFSAIMIRYFLPRPVD